MQAFVYLLTPVLVAGADFVQCRDSGGSPIRKKRIEALRIAESSNCLNQNWL